MVAFIGSGKLVAINSSNITSTQLFSLLLLNTNESHYAFSISFQVKSLIPSFIVSLALSLWAAFWIITIVHRKKTEGR